MQKLNLSSTRHQYRITIDLPLTIMLMAICTLGLIILYSASNENHALVNTQMVRTLFAFIVMITLAQIHPRHYYQWAPWVYAFTCLLLLIVLIVGVSVKGAPRWISLGVIRFQPSELMKLSMPLMLSWYFEKKHLPPDRDTLLTCLAIIIIPTFLVLIEPDMGTAIIIAITAGTVLLLTGIHWRLIALTTAAGMACLPLLWHFMHQYQRDRVLTFLNPQRDPLGAGYHIIQSKIAIGSGAFSGKGWLQGSQGHLHFLPEHTTDFIFSLFGEEFGFIGALLLIFSFIAVTLRGLKISQEANTTFARLLASSLSLSFFLSMAINIAMVSGLLPVVGLPLPLISRGGTSLVTWMAFFGMIMSIGTHKHMHTSPKYNH